MTPAERISSDTWNRLKQARSLDVRLGEETLTDLLLLDLRAHESSYRIHVFQSTKKHEAIFGTDLEIFVRDQDGSTYLYAIQAKKIDHRKSIITGPPTASRTPAGQYMQLGKTSSGTLQLDLLEKFAKNFDAIPCYLLYNFASPSPCSSPTRYWHCCDCSCCKSGCENSQFGCTLAPSWVIRKAIDPPRGNRNFHYIHEHQVVLPWRCLFDCPFTPLPHYIFGTAPTRHTWPEQLLREHKESGADFIDRYCERQDRPADHRPRRLLLIDRQIRELNRTDR